MFLNSTYHGKPQPSFLGIVTHNLGCKTVIFHGFGVQGYISHLLCMTWDCRNWKRSSWSFGCSRPYPTWHQSMPRILWGITTPGSCQWWGVPHAVFDNDSDMAWYMPCWRNIHKRLSHNGCKPPVSPWLAEPQPTSNWCVSFLIQNDMPLEVSECFEAWLKRSMVDHRGVHIFATKKISNPWKGVKSGEVVQIPIHNFVSFHFRQESPSVEVSFTGAGEGGTFLSWRFYL